VYAQAQWSAKVGFDLQLRSAGTAAGGTLSKTFRPAGATSLFPRYPEQTEARALACGALTEGGGLAVAAAMWGYVAQPRARLDHGVQIQDVGLIGPKGQPAPPLNHTQREWLVRAEMRAQELGFNETEIARLKERMRP